jgi:hypothetical protein
VLPSGSIFSGTRLIPRRLTGSIPFRIRSFVAGVSFLALFRPGRIRSATLVCRATRIGRSVFLCRSGLARRWSLLRLGRICAGLHFSRVRFFRGALAL